MITVADAVANIVQQSPLLEEGLSRGLMNTSAVARDIRSRVEKMTLKEVTEGAVVMALQRLSGTLTQMDYSQNVLFKSSPDMVIRSNLFEYTVSNSPTLNKKQQKILALVSGQYNQEFLTITSSVFETTIIASNSLKQNVLSILEGETVVGEISELSSITIRLTENMVITPGFYSQILRVIAWEGINVAEVVSTYLELTIILHQKDSDRAYSVLKSAFA